MKRLVPAFIAALLIGLSPAAHSAPKKKSKPGNQQTPTPKETPAPAPAPTPTPAPQGGTYSGVVRSVTIGKEGNITEFYVRISGTDTAVQRLLGCGAKMSDHPMLFWAIENHRLVHFNVDNDLCLNNMIIGSLD